jgi:uncharacterized membrane protein YphA (DoxX/SURF4 family)
MINLSKAGRIFFGIAVAIIGLQAIYSFNLPYILALPDQSSHSVAIAAALIIGAVFALAGICILFEIKTRLVSLLFGGLLLLIFLLYCIPSEIITDPGYTHFGDWENAEKELAFAGGAFAVAGCFTGVNNNRLTAFLSRLIPSGAILFAITIVSFGILHFMEAKDGAAMVPAWIPWHLFWMYFCGAALIGPGLAIIFKIKVKLFAGLLGLMIFLWVVLLHIPRVISAPAADFAGEFTSAFLALAYSGIAFVIAGSGNKVDL